jgi:hypothetical protein
MGTLLTALFILAIACIAPVAEGVVHSTKGTPSSNFLDYLDVRSSSSTGSNCAISVSGNNLVFANAKITHSPAGYIDCKPVLTFKNIPQGYSFSIDRVSVAGYLKLEKGCYVEKIQVELRYPV